MKSITPIAVLLIGFASGAVARADESLLESLTPRVALGFDIFVQHVDSAFDTSDAPLLNGSVHSFETNGATTLTTPTATIDAMLVGPGFWKDYPWIRPFVRAGGQIATKPTRVIQRDDLREAQNELEVETPYFWSAGFGLEFGFPVLGLDVFVRPSLEYFGEQVKYSGHIELFEQAIPTDFNSLVKTFDASFSEENTYHALGPRFDIEGVVGQVGPISVGLYGEARFGWLLNDPFTEATIPNSVGTGSGSFRFEMDEFLAQGGAGVRLTWTGFGHE